MCTNKYLVHSEVPALVQQTHGAAMVLLLQAMRISSPTTLATATLPALASEWGTPGSV